MVFKKGNIPHNKDKKGWTNGGSFKKRHKIIKGSEKGQFKRNNKINLGKKNALGYRHTKNALKKMSKENNHNWKGDNVGYSGVHNWLSKQFGKATLCEFDKSHKAKRFEWAHIRKEYTRNRKDYIQLCPSCHRKYDLGLK